ncbi:chromosome (plasmid) partitioning protein ParA [Gracilibacillus boraciitolerans JCM 21714]|uniref:Chromosome (Plasmid) partitioning protein ParA n=1 Tax=Gracilibacillus boraciitolerans JCM 21714 TaxID=1298598 RepID=W4VJN3_9BACI|nr:ParA family protein [Gracilibacillus boraciitolerans]GAE93028.1 chromosome (plasmid) partitioning protein ParA [Gracilibacillus boraciitolerans JCM 21714]
MSKVITFGLQKGGVGKSTTVGVVSHLFAKDGYKVLVVDMDSQGNVSETLSGLSSNEFEDKSIFEAIITKNPKEYIYKADEKIDLIPANNYLALFPKWIYTNDYFGDTFDLNGKAYEQLKLTLDSIKDDYDYILIDTPPPALSEQTTNALIASDYVVTMYECSQYCYSAIENFFKSIESAQSIQERTYNKGLRKLGILRTLTDKRRSDAKMFNELIESDYPELVFNTIITRKASTGRLPVFGFNADNKELNDAIKEYKDFYKELLARIERTE